MISMRDGKAKGRNRVGNRIARGIENDRAERIADSDAR
jgi:hypothetical protein